jgi:pimeloyl-ACP methyl ester carboxylesterase
METLPTPTGAFAIGTPTRHWVDESRPELFAGRAAGPRELMVQLWYPARSGSGGRLARYVDDARTLEQLALLMRLPPNAFAAMSSVSTHAVLDAPIAEDGRTYPVLLFSHGRCGVREHNTFQVEELASHGYIVVTIDHPYAASGVRFPDGRLVEFDPRLLPPWPRHDPEDPEGPFLDSVIPFLADDVAFVHDRLHRLNDDPNDVLSGRLDLGRVGIFGVSLGGVVAAAACQRQPALRALLTMDAAVPWDVVSAGLMQPVMWMTRDAATMRREGWSEADISDLHVSMRTSFERLPGPGYILLVPGMYHIDFSDGRLISPLIEACGISGPIDGQRARDIVRRYSLAFFDRHLSELPAPLLDERPENADLLFESRRATAGSAVAV